MFQMNWRHILINIVPPMLGFFGFGIAIAFTEKGIMIAKTGIFDENGEERVFAKPWFLTSVTFFAMSNATIIYFLMQLKNRELLRIQELSFSDFCEFIAPAISDALEGILSLVTVAFVGNSYDSMMKAGTLIGCSLLARFWFKRYYYPHQWWAIVVVILSITMVGCAGVLNSGNDTINTSPGVIAIILTLKIMSQIGYSVKLSYEEYFQKEKNYHPIMVCGLEGCWSSIVCLCICLPAAQYLPGTDGLGIHEDTVETIRMIKGNPLIIIGIVFLYIISLSYNIISNYLIKASSSVVRSLMESVRTFVIWMLSFVIYYSLNASKNPEINYFKQLGEDWGNGSYLQIVGFVIMTFGILQYNGWPMFKCWKYADSEGEVEVQLDLDKVEADEKEEAEQKL